MTLPTNKRLVTGIPYKILAPMDPALGITVLEMNPVINLGEGPVSIVNGFQGAVSGPIASGTGQILVLNNNFANRAYVLVGPYRFESDVDFAANGLALGVVATNLAAAISRLTPQGFSATSVGPVVSVLAPNGPGAWVLAAEYEGMVLNFSFTPSNGYLATGGPAVSGPTF